MSVQTDCSSFKLLLKQVYSVHTTKIKELENEIKALKEQLIQKERETDRNLSECKRCVELEEAFKSCKKALYDQSKVFESFGKKFSVFSSPELGIHENKNESIFFETERFSRSLKNNATLWDKDESSPFSLGEVTITEDKINGVEKPVVSNKQNLLRKVMCNDVESFDLCTVTFPENVNQQNRQSDSSILAPDSLDASLCAKKPCESVQPKMSSKWHRKTLNPTEKDNSKETEKNKAEPKTSMKRISDSSSAEINEVRAKRTNTGNQMENCSKSKTKDLIACGNQMENCSKSRTKDLLVCDNKMDNCSKSRTKDLLVCDNKMDNCSKSTAKDLVVCDLQVPKILTSNKTSDVLKEVEVKTKLSLKDTNVQSSKMSKKKLSTTDEKEFQSNKYETPKNHQNNVTNDLKNKFTSPQVSPSLLSTDTNARPKIMNIESELSDHDDFQELAPAVKSGQNEDSWDSCDKKKLAKKNPKLKSIKCTSKFKMTLDAPPLNFKKPNLKQTKLSKSIFKTKEVISNENSPSRDQEVELIEDDSSPGILQGDFHTSTQCGPTKSPFVVDIDATYIPENFKFESSRAVTSNVKKNAVEKSNFKNGGLFSNICFPEELRSSEKDEDFCKNADEISDHSSLDEGELKENMNSFDRLPLPEEPNYKYKNDVVRKKSERRQLNGFDCKECEKYYSDLGLTDKEKKERMKKCSRHRGKFTPPSTPDHFWELDFPDTEECKARGYMNATQKVKLNDICNI